MTIYPGAVYRPVVNHGGSMTSHLGLILHVCQGNGSQFNNFNNPSNPKSSHWWISKSGQVEQYVDADYAAWAQAAGNYTYHSVETEGFTTEPLTAQQLAHLSALYAWGATVYGWPLKLANKVGEAGLGTHGMGGVSWGNHPGCPGKLRAAERSTIISGAGAIMSLSQADINAIVQAVWNQPVIVRNDPTGKPYNRSPLQEIADSVTLGLEFRARESVIDSILPLLNSISSRIDSDNVELATLINGIKDTMLTSPIDTTVVLTTQQVTDIALAVKAALSTP